MNKKLIYGIAAVVVVIIAVIIFAVYRHREGYSVSSDGCPQCQDLASFQSDCMSMMCDVDSLSKADYDTCVKANQSTCQHAAQQNYNNCQANRTACLKSQ